MNQKLHDWFILIEHWVTRGGNGYSLPFLVGATARHRGIVNITEDYAIALLGEIFNYPVNKHVVQIILCPNLGVPVFGLSRHEIQGKLFHSLVNNEPSVFIRQDLLNEWGKSRDEVINGIFDGAKKPIQDGLFSRTFDHTWALFSETEIERIDRLLKDA
ncbi:MAG: hypothetical protein ACOYZ6_16505 [Chloroflexota bacterium]